MFVYKMQWIGIVSVFILIYSYESIYPNRDLKR